MSGSRLYMSYLMFLREIAKNKELETEPICCLFINDAYEFDWRHNFLDIYPYRIKEIENPVRITGIKTKMDSCRFRMDGDPISIQFNANNVRCCIYKQGKALEDCIPIGWISGGDSIFFVGDSIYWEYKFNASDSLEYLERY